MEAPDFCHEIEIEVPLANVHACLCDLERLAPLHPLIESIEGLPASDSMPRARRYRVIDRIPFGPFRLRTVYTAALDPVTDREVRGHAWQSPGITLHSIYTLEATEQGTRLIERVMIEAPWILRRFVVAQARHAHEETLAKLKALLEEGEPLST
jgi:hypothetical protein